MCVVFLSGITFNLDEFFFAAQEAVDLATEKEQAVL